MGKTTPPQSAGRGRRDACLAAYPATRPITTILSAPSRSVPRRTVRRRAPVARNRPPVARRRAQEQHKEKEFDRARQRRRRKRWTPTNNLHSPIITPAQMRAAEEAAFARGITAETLMEQAGAGIARAVAKFFPRAGKCLVFAGKGHNAGDALVAARWLAEVGWEIETRLVFPEKELSALTSQEAGASCVNPGRWEGPLRPDQAKTPRPSGRKGPSHIVQTIILDGLLGLGAHPPLREPIRERLSRDQFTPRRCARYRNRSPDGPGRRLGRSRCRLCRRRFHDHGRLREERPGRGFRDRLCRPA